VRHVRKKFLKSIFIATNMPLYKQIYQHWNWILNSGCSIPTFSTTNETFVLTTTENTFEGPSEFDGHGVVEDGVDSAIDVDHGPAEHEKPQVVVLVCRYGIVHDHGSIGHPRHRKHKYDHGQHSNHLKYIENVIFDLDSGSFKLSQLSANCTRRCVKVLCSDIKRTHWISFLN